MPVTRLKSSLNNFLNIDNLSIVMYFRLKSGEIKLADINNNILPDLKNLYIENIKKTITEKEEIELLSLSEADERKNVIYDYDFEIKIEPFISIDKVINNNGEILKFHFADNKLEDIDAFITKIGNSGNSLILYSKVYSVNLIKQDKTLKLIPASTRFDRFDNQILRLNGKFEILSLEKKHYISNYDILEKFYSFNDVIKCKAQKNIEKIEELNVIDNIDCFKNSMQNILLARKFVKATSSSIVIKKKISANDIVLFAKDHIKLKDEFNYNVSENKFILDTKKTCQLFIKLLDDDFLHSKLTNTDYDALAKNNM